MHPRNVDFRGYHTRCSDDGTCQRTSPCLVNSSYTAQPKLVLGFLIGAGKGWQPGPTACALHHTFDSTLDLVLATSSSTSPRCVAVRASATPRSQRVQELVTGAALALSLSFAPMASAEFRLPPIDRDPARCERGFVGNTIGQANAVSDKLLDLRQCKFVGANLKAKVLAGALMSDADFSKADMKEAVLTKAYARNANLSGADLTNGVIDRVDFTGSNMTGITFVNAIITGTIFEGVNLADANFEDAVIGNEDAKRLCANPTLTGESRAQVGCRT